MKRVALLLCISLLAPALSVLAQDPYGRSMDRVLKTESMARTEDDLKAEKAVLDKYSAEQRERMALALVMFEPGESGEITVDLKVRHGGKAAISMKGLRLELEPAEETRKWAVTTGSFGSPKKWKPLKVVVTPPGQPDRRVSCTQTKPIGSGDRVVFAILPLTTNGDFYCPPPHHASAEET